MSDNIKRFTLRMPEELFDELKEVADYNFRPISKEILVAVREYLDRHSSER